MIVIGYRSQQHVVKVQAPWIITAMPDHCPLRDRSTVVLPEQAVDQLYQSPATGRSLPGIPLSIRLTLPLVAARARNNLRLNKSQQFLWYNHTDIIH